MKKKMIIGLGGIIVVLLAGLYLYPKIVPTKPERTILYWTDPMLPGDRSDRPGKSPMGMERVPVYAGENIKDSANATGYYTCPMHPSVHKGRPGACPICGMTLVKRNDGVETSEHHVSGTLAVSPSKQVLANVSTTQATRRALQKEIRSVGTIAYAEPNIRNITMRFPGRLEKLYLTYTGQSVKKGEPVAEVYSPDAISAQQEYLLARDAYEQVKDAADLISGSARDLLQQSREKLVQWGITDEQIAGLESSRQPMNAIVIYSPSSGVVIKKNVDPQHYASVGEDLFDLADLSTVWVYIDVYEYELPLLKIGQGVLATSEAYPDREFRGKVAFINPTLDPSSRTARIRVEVPNPGGNLRVGMFVNATISVQLSSAIVIPISAVIATGGRQIVWIEKQEEVFEPRDVRLGVRGGTSVQVLSGIAEGERVVSSGGYLIDSESQLEAATNSTTDEDVEGKMEHHD